MVHARDKFVNFNEMQIYARTGAEAEENENEHNTIIEFAIVCDEKNNWECCFFIWILICKLVRQL